MEEWKNGKMEGWNFGTQMAIGGKVGRSFTTEARRTQRRH